MSSSDPPRLLSVEDNPETRLLLKHLLKDSYDVTFAADVEEALDIVEADDAFDLLLLDIHLSSEEERGGTELLHRIRGREETGEIPAIAVTAYAMPGDREDLLAKGFDDYVNKPFAGAELTEAIEQTLSAT